MNLLLCLAQLQDHLTVLQNAAPVRLALLSESTMNFSNQCQHPMHFDRAGDTKACFFYFDVPCGCWPWFCSALGVTYQDHEADGNMQSAQTSARELLLVFGIPPPLGFTQQRKQKNNHAALHCACIRTHSWYAREKLLCRRWHYWTSNKLLFICGDWQLCRRGFALAALCILFWLLGDSWCWEKNQDYFPSVNKTELFPEIL